jgi:peroxiredoxin
MPIVTTLVEPARLAACTRHARLHAMWSKLAPLTLVALCLIGAARGAPPEPPAAVPAAQPSPTATPGKAALRRRAPEFTLPDLDGNQVSLRALRGKLVVLEWFNPDCPFVKHAHGKGPLQDLARRRQSAKLVWLSINSSAPGKQGHGLERNRAAKSEYGIENPILLDESGEVGRRYGAEKTPHLFVIDAKGLLVYRGGLDNAPMGAVDDARPRLPGSPAGALEPYLENALDDVLKGRAPRLADTPAYGCSVKYQTP